MSYVDKSLVEEEVDFFSIDLRRLHQEWAKQPRLYHRYADLLVSARKDYEYAKSEREFIAAELELAIRKEPERFGLDRVREKSVEKRVITCKKFRRAEAAVIEAHANVGKLEAIIRTLEHRKSALQDSVQLFLSDYWADPRLPKEANRIMRETQAKNAFKRNKTKDD